MTVQIVTLPSSPAPSGATYTLVSKATEMSGPLGGPTQRVLRVGSRFKVEFELPALKYGDARQWLARFIAAEALPAAILFPQRGFQPFNPAASDFVRVVGAQTAMTNTGGVLNVGGGQPGFELVSGQFFHLSAQADGRRYIHQIVSDVAFASDGTATLAIQPPLRVVPTAADALEFVAPMIEGFITMGWNWQIALARRVSLKFTLTEDR